MDHEGKYGTLARQKELLEDLKQINKLFQENGISYSLAAGTLLGAVRENGFIPWDDDVDIMFNRENYNKAVQAFAQGRIPGYRLNRILWISRIQKDRDTREGLSAATIDMFVMDVSPENRLLRKVKLVLILMLQGMMKTGKSHEGISRFYRLCQMVTYVMGKPFSEERKFRWYERAAQIGNGSKSDFLGMYYDPFEYLSRRYKKTIFDQMEFHRFEDTDLPITCEYDSCLSTAYGDYMTPPEESQRVAPHGFA